MEPREEEIKFTPDYEAGESIFWHVFEGRKPPAALVTIF